MMNRQQADALRRENEARSAAAWRKTQDSFAASNRAAQAAHQAQERATSDAAHQQRMNSYRQAGQSAWGSSFPNASNTGRGSAGVSGGRLGGSTKSSGGGLLFVAVVIGAIVAVSHSNSGSSHSSNRNSAPSAYSGYSSSSDNSSTLSSKPLAGSNGTQPATAGARSSLPDANPFSPGATNSASSSTTTETRPADAPVPAAAPYTPPPLVPLTKIGAVYPAAALHTRPAGPVLVSIGVEPNGTVGSVGAESGDPLLVPAALAAARQWTFRPYAYEPGRPMHTMRISFEFAVPPVANTGPAASPNYYSRPNMPYTSSLPATPSLQVVSKVAPTYPFLARQEHITGLVEVMVYVAPNGAVTSARATKGNAVLAEAAESAARSWRYAPYQANAGDPLRTSTINFKFGRE